MRVTVRLDVENLSRSRLAAGGVAGNPGTALGGAAQHHALHHLAHRNGGLGLQNTPRGIHGRRLAALFENELGFHQQPAVGDRSAGARKLDRRRANLLAHGDGGQRSLAPPVQTPE